MPVMCWQCCKRSDISSQRIFTFTSTSTWTEKDGGGGGFGCSVNNMSGGQLLAALAEATVMQSMRS